MQIDKAVEEFLLTIQVGRAQSTRSTYRFTLWPFVEWCTANGIDDTGQLTKSVVRRFMADAASRYGQYHLQHVMRLLRRFLRWLVDEVGIADLSGVVTIPPVRPTLQRVLSREEVRRLLDGCDDTPMGLRNAAIISLLTDTGLRASEVISLTVRDVDMRKQTVKVRIKGGKEFNVRFGDHTKRRLSDWLHDAGIVDKPAHPVFFSVGNSSKGTPLSRHSLRFILAHLGDQCGVENVTVHAFRRTFATELLREGVSTRLVQILGRWQSANMVELYSQQLEHESISISLADMLDDDND